jgi:hypothetical protein
MLREAAVGLDGGQEIEGTAAEPKLPIGTAAMKKGSVNTAGSANSTSEP